MCWTVVVEHRFDNTPRVLHHVLPGEAMHVSVEGIVEQADVGAVAPAQNGVEVDREVDRAGGDLPAGLLGLHCHGDACVVAES